MANDVPPNFSIVTLGVADLARAASFYESLGWEQHGDLSAGITWFKTSGTWIGLFGYADLAEDVGSEPAPMEALPPYRGITLAVNLPSEGEVDAAFERVEAVGGRTVKSPVRLEWGGYAGYFADPDGHLWELWYNPGFPIDAQGRIDIP